MRFDANGGLTADLTAREWEEEEEGENDCRAWNVLTVRNGCAIRQRERERERMVPDASPCHAMDVRAKQQTDITGTDTGTGRRNRQTETPSQRKEEK